MIDRWSLMSASRGASDLNIGRLTLHARVREGSVNIGGMPVNSHGLQKSAAAATSAGWAVCPVAAPSPAVELHDDAGLRTERQPRTRRDWLLRAPSGSGCFLCRAHGLCPFEPRFEPIRPTRFVSLVLDQATMLGRCLRRRACRFSRRVPDYLGPSPLGEARRKIRRRGASPGRRGCRCGRLSLCP